MKTMYSEGDALTRWIRGLPLRWTLGGFILALVWFLASSLLQNSFSSPLGGYLAAIVRLFAFIVLPLCALGFVWGWSERIRLQRQLAQSRTHLSQAINAWIFRQTAKAMLCGLLFGIFTYVTTLFRFQLWGNVALSDNFTGVLAFAILAAPVGGIVGAVSKQNLRQHLSGYDLPKAAE
jgi:hypothetical protein